MGSCIGCQSNTEISVVELQNFCSQIDTILPLTVPNTQLNTSFGDLINETENTSSFNTYDIHQKLIIIIKFKQAVEIRQRTKLYAVINVMLNHLNKNFRMNLSAMQKLYVYSLIQSNMDHLNQITANFNSLQNPDKIISISVNNEHVNLQTDVKMSNRFKIVNLLILKVESSINQYHHSYFTNSDDSLFQSTSKESSVSRNEHNIYKQDNERMVFDITDKVNRQKMKQISNICSQTDTVNVDSTYLLKSHSTDNRPSCGNCQHNVLNCLCLERVGNALKQYQTFCHINNKSITYNEKQCILSNNYNEICVLNDFHHLLELHSYEFEDIYNKLVERSTDGQICELKHCFILRRNLRNRTILSNNDIELKNLYFDRENKDIIQQQILDKIHCHYFHSFDIGYRISQNDKMQMQQLMDEAKEIDANSCVHDKILSAIYANIAEKKVSCHNIKGLEQLNKNSNKFTSIIDTNIQPLYSYGYRFFYWDYYKKNRETRDDARGSIAQFLPANEGYLLLDFYVNPKFKDLRDELINNGICIISKHQWDILLSKAMMHLNTEHFRKQICKKTMQHYGITENTNISVEHLASMMLYCNNDVLQREFSETYRKVSSNETINSLIIRHSNFCYLGRFLRECVDCFADNDWTNNNKRALYHGINFDAQFSSLYACIKGPLSTSTDYSVAANFCAQTGTIIELDVGRSWVHDSKNGMNLWECKYLSDYPNEQEVFFIGGHERFMFHNIIRAELGENYRFYVAALALISQLYGSMDEQKELPILCMDQQATVEQMCFRILSHELHTHYQDDSEYYEYKSMPSYIEGIIHKHFASVTELYLNDLSKSDTFIYKLFRSLFFYDNGWIKLDVLTKTFPSLQMIYLHGMHDELHKCPSMYSSLLSLLQSHSDTNLQYIRVSILNENKIIDEADDIIRPFLGKFVKFGWTFSIKFDEAECGVYTHIHMKSTAYKPNQITEPILLYRSRSGQFHKTVTRLEQGVTVHKQTFNFKF